jgi:hypothetical protein
VGILPRILNWDNRATNFNRWMIRQRSTLRGNCQTPRPENQGMDQLIKFRTLLVAEVTGILIT